VPTRSELEEVPPVHAWQQAIKGIVAARKNLVIP
jgi:hypothetical protein